MGSIRRVMVQERAGRWPGRSTCPTQRRRSPELTATVACIHNHPSPCVAHPSPCVLSLPGRLQTLHDIRRWTAISLRPEWSASVVGTPVDREWPGSKVDCICIDSVVVRVRWLCLQK